MSYELLSEHSGLSQNTINKIIAVLTQHPELEKAVLYGSRAKGNYRPGSDIDLTLFGNNLTFAQLNKIEIQLDDILLPYSFDLSLFQHIENPALIEHIMRVGIVFYQKP
jgi:uncharacterized protein